MNNISALSGTTRSLVDSSQQNVHPGGGDFMSMLNGAMKQADSLQNDANTQVANLLRGDGQDVHGAMIAVEKADISFQLMMQVRNKVVNAYQEISRMQF